ncbi:hypothetical protein GCM10022254_42400 [Actinomadura meridiana]|uniref:Uncharacterized protein n=1 Tax=Actinomadura meridiana TaxID=559626 RepID=A0ABP8C852_9ACTN
MQFDAIKTGLNGASSGFRIKHHADRPVTLRGLSPVSRSSSATPLNLGDKESADGGAQWGLTQWGVQVPGASWSGVVAVR